MLEIGKFCHCGSPATNAARDVQENTAPGDSWKSFKPKGDWKFGCDAHPVSSVTFNLKGEPENKFSDEAYLKRMVLTEKHLG